MARPSIIDKKKLPGLIKSGKTQKQIADIYGVTEASVSIAVKQLKIATGKAILIQCLIISPPPKYNILCFTE